MSNPGGVSRTPIWLIVSLLANMLLIGVVAGGLLAGGGEQRHHPPRLNEGDVVRSIVRAAPSEERAEMRRAFRQAWRESRELRRARSEARQRVNAAMTVEPYDAEAMQEAFANLREAEIALQARIQTLLAHRLSALEPDQRRALASAMAARRGHMRHHSPGEHPPPHHRPPGHGD